MSSCGHLPCRTLSIQRCRQNFYLSTTTWQIMYTTVVGSQPTSSSGSTAPSICSCLLCLLPTSHRGECTHLGEVATCQALPIVEVVLLCMIHSLLMLTLCRACQPAFLITPTEVMLLSSVLSPRVPKYTSLMWGICTEGSNSMDWMQFLPKWRTVRVGK